ncbi:MAG: (2Fe-2S)-binding protein [Desulfurococcales archaeon ex4484_204]|nr:MAG: (2Fe-2S)-binding protein [Desulfurococcales archaeon ex4484_204]
MRVRFKLNGEPVEVDVEPNELLINVLRERFGLTGTKYACGIGECGACTVLLDGEPVLSCLTLAADVDGHEVVTVEGLAKSGELTPVQRAFIEEGAVQCGYCIPGFVIMAESLLRENPEPTEAEIRDYIRGNLCRCTGYVNIVKAVKRASKYFKLAPPGS